MFINKKSEVMKYLPAELMPMRLQNAADPKEALKIWVLEVLDCTMDHGLIDE
eukprot:c29806_g1_i1 orf=182-337(+)